VDKIKWYESTTLRALLLAFVSQVIVWSGLSETLPEGTAVLAVDAALQLLAIAATAYAAWARANHANPPITNAAAAKTETMIANTTPTDKTQSGFIRLRLVTAVAALCVGAALVPVTMSLHGCAQLGVTQAKTFNENVAYAMAQTTALREAATVSLNAGQLSVEDAEYVLQLTDRSRTMIDAARVAHTEGRMQLVINVLTQLQAYLNAKGVQQ
jgi:hypothetical protein